VMKAIIRPKKMHFSQETPGRGEGNLFSMP